jgi:hypothetical protein
VLFSSAIPSGQPSGPIPSPTPFNLFVQIKNGGNLPILVKYGKKKAENSRIPLRCHIPAII